MKKVLLVAALVLGTIALQAQVYLTDVLKPAEEHRLKTTTSKADTKNYDAMRIAHIYHVNATLVLSGAAHGLVGSDDHAYATYKLNGAYSKLTFWLGPTYRAGGLSAKSLLTITADGKRVFDQPVFNYDPPRFVTIDVKGVDEIKFKVLVGELDIALAYAQLWKEGVAVVQPKLPVTYPQGKIKFVEQLLPYYTTGYINPIQPKDKAPTHLRSILVWRKVSVCPGTSSRAAYNLPRTKNSSATRRITPISGLVNAMRNCPLSSVRVTTKAPTPPLGSLSMVIRKKSSMKR